MFTSLNPKFPRHISLKLLALQSTVALCHTVQKHNTQGTSFPSYCLQSPWDSDAQEEFRVCVCLRGAVLPEDHYYKRWVTIFRCLCAHHLWTHGSKYSFICVVDRFSSLDPGTKRGFKDRLILLQLVRGLGGCVSVLELWKLKSPARVYHT